MMDQPQTDVTTPRRETTERSRISLALSVLSHRADPCDPLAVLLTAILTGADLETLVAR